MERAIVRDVRVVDTLSVITVAGLPDDAGATASVLRAIAPHAGPLVRYPAGPDGVTIVFTASTAEAAGLVRELAGTGPVREDDMAEVSLLGEGLRTDPAITPTFCEALVREGIALRLLSVGGTSLSVVCPAEQVAGAVRALVEAFEIPGPGPAVPWPRRGGARLSWSTR